LKRSFGLGLGQRNRAFNVLKLDKTWFGKEVMLGRK